MLRTRLVAVFGKLEVLDCGLVFFSINSKNRSPFLSIKLWVLKEKERNFLLCVLGLLVLNVRLVRRKFVSNVTLREKEKFSSLNFSTISFECEEIFGGRFLSFEEEARILELAFPETFYFSKVRATRSTQSLSYFMVTCLRSWCVWICWVITCYI